MIDTPYGTITHRVLAATSDGTDANLFPDATIIHDLVVRLTPSVTSAVYTVGGAPVEIVPGGERGYIEARYDAQGNLVASLTGSLPLRVPATRGPDVVGSWHFGVEWLTGWNRQLLARTTVVVDQGGTVDLTTARLHPSTGAGFMTELLEQARAVIAAGPVAEAAEAAAAEATSARIRAVEAQTAASLDANRAVAARDRAETAASLVDQDMIDDIRAAADALDGAVSVDDTKVAMLLSTDTNTRASVAARVRQIAPPLPGPATPQVSSGATIRPIGMVDGVLYGAGTTPTLHTSLDDGTTWVPGSAGPAGSIHTIILCPDGEVVAANSASVWRSTGWGSPTLTWGTAKVTKSDPAGPGILPWSIDGDGTKFIATEYSGAANRGESRYIWISIDMGITWNIVLDKQSIDPADESHMHGVCYDPWEGRFWVSHGHGAIRGVYYSDDDGGTWAKVGGPFQPDAAPTTLKATDDGIVCGSDSAYGGVYGIPRTQNPGDMRMVPLARWNVPRDGVAGFASTSVRDPITGLIYIAFKSDWAEVPGGVAAGTARGARFIWMDTPRRTDHFQHLEITPRNTLVGAFGVGGALHGFSAKVGPGDSQGYDAGGITGGDTSGWVSSLAAGVKSWAQNQFATAIGALAKATTRGTAIGHRSEAGLDGTTPDATAIGHTAVATASFATAVGSRAATASTFGTVIGALAKVVGGHGVAIGHNALATLQSVAIGSGVSTDGPNAIAIGFGSRGAANTTAVGSAAVADKTGTTAIGQGATANVQPDSTAIGSGAQAAAWSATAVGRQAHAAANYSTAVGKSAQASAAGTNGLALGENAVVEHDRGVALGRGTTTTAPKQVNIGARHFEVLEDSAPSAPGSNAARLFVRDDGSGKTQLCVRFETGPIQVIATQP